MTFIFDIDPCPAPRMTNSDRWNPSKAASRYFGFRNHLVSLARVKGLDGLPDSLESLIFHIPMSGSWSQEKQNAMRGTPHQQTPDLDNLCKSFLDALCPTDQHIHTIRNMQKCWADFGSIELTIERENEMKHFQDRVA